MGRGDRAEEDRDDLGQRGDSAGPHADRGTAEAQQFAVEQLGGASGEDGVVFAGRLEVGEQAGDGGGGVPFGVCSEDSEVTQRCRVRQLGDGDAEGSEVGQDASPEWWEVLDGVIEADGVDADRPVGAGSDEVSESRVDAAQGVRRTGRPAGRGGQQCFDAGEDAEAFGDVCT